MCWQVSVGSIAMLCILVMLSQRASQNTGGATDSFMPSSDPSPNPSYVVSSLTALTFDFYIFRVLYSIGADFVPKICKCVFYFAWIQWPDCLYILPVTMQQQACASSVFCAASPDLAHYGGLYINNCVPCQPSSAALDPVLSNRLWVTSLAMIERIMGRRAFNLQYLGGEVVSWINGEFSKSWNSRQGT